MRADEASASLDLEQPLRALPVQVCQLDGGVLLCRGASEVRLRGAGASEAVRLVFEALSERAQTPAELARQVAGPERSRLLELIAILARRRLLVAADASAIDVAAQAEEPLDVLYWELGLERRQVSSRLGEVRISILGINAISDRLLHGLHLSEARNVQVVDYPLLRNLSFFDGQGRVRADRWTRDVPVLSTGQWTEASGLKRGDCVVAASEFGGAHLLRKWNEFCVSRELHFYPVVLDRYTGYLGPLTIPGETPCYECTRARENANFQKPELERAREFESASHQAAVGAHPCMASLVGELASLELLKFYARLAPPRADRLIEFNLLGGEMRSRKVLRIPRCSVCSGAFERPGMSTLKHPGVTKEIVDFYRDQTP